MNTIPTKNMAQTNPNRFNEIARYGEFLTSHLMMFDPHRRIEVLMYTIAAVFMEVHPVPGHTTLTAFDDYMKATRETIEKNLAAQAAEKLS